MAFDETGFQTVDASQQFTCGTTTIGFDSSTGGISKLKGPGGIYSREYNRQSKSSRLRLSLGLFMTYALPGVGTDWASKTKQLAQPWYRNDDVDYYHQFDKEYNGHDTGNFMKPNLLVHKQSARCLVI